MERLLPKSISKLAVAPDRLGFLSVGYAIIGNFDHVIDRSPLSVNVPSVPACLQQFIQFPVTEDLSQRDVNIL